MAKRTLKKRRQKPVTSPYCKPSTSRIHQQGLFASKRIPADTEIIPYVGEKVSKKEGDRRAIDLADAREGTGDASVYMFILDDNYDIDGNVPHNTARLINHSCDPNCEAQIIDDEIWIVALRDIAKGAELTFDYGFDLEHFEDHPCRCGSDLCVGYIVAREYWPDLEEKLAAKKSAQAAKKKKKKKTATRKKKQAAKKAKAPTAKKATKKSAKSRKKAASKPVRKKPAKKTKSPATKKAVKATKKAVKASKKKKKTPARSKTRPKANKKKARPKSKKRSR